MWQQDAALSLSGTGYVPCGAGAASSSASSANGSDSGSGQPMRRLDMRWSRLTLDQLRDEDFMAKQLRRMEISAGARRTSNAAGVGRWDTASGLVGSSNATAQSPRMSIRQRLQAAQSKAARGVTGDSDDDVYDQLNDPIGDPELKRGVVAHDADLEEANECELVNALCVLGDLDQPELVRIMIHHLKGVLHRSCTFPNPVYQLVALRRQILLSMHEAIAVQHRQEKAALQLSLLILNCLQNPAKCLSTGPSMKLTSMDRTRSQLAPQPTDGLTAYSSSIQSPARPKEKAAREATMGIQVLLCVLTDLRDPSVTPLAQKKEFLGDLLPLIRSMAPLALAPKCNSSANSPTVALSTVRGQAPRPVGLSGGFAPGSSDISAFAERVQRFLLDICPRPVLKIRPLSSPKVQAIASASNDLDVADHTDAVHGLIHLAAATGSVRDFLVVLRVLLGASDSASEVATKENQGPFSARSLPLAASVPSLSTVRAEDLFPSPHDSEQHDETAARLKVQTNVERVCHTDTIVKPQQESPSSNREHEALRENEAQDLLKRKTRSKGLKTITSTVSSVTTTASLAIPHPGSQHHRLYSTPGSSLVSKQRVKEDLKDTILLGSGNLTLDMSKMKDAASRDSAHAPVLESHNEVPIFTTRCPKFKRLNVQSVLRELDRTKLSTPSRTSKGKAAASIQHMYASFLGFAGEANIFSVDDDTEEREVWSCGQNSYGELGHGDTMSRKSFERVESLQQKDIVQIGAGNEHTIALTADGKVLTCGYNDNGQCGQGGTTRVSHLSEIPKMSDSQVAQVHAYNGCEHSILITLDGRAATCGYNYRGQLGHGNTTSESVPKLVRSLESRIVHLVSCSYYHTIMACEADGGGRHYVCTFGRNDYGQLGHNDTIDRKVPQYLEALNDQHVVSVACGQYHTLVVTAAGNVFGFGKNDYGQLGVDSMENQLVPVHVRGGLEKEDCMEVRCGYYHSIVLCSGAHLYGFGRNDYGQLGLGRANASPAVNLQLQQQRFPYARLIEELEGKEIVHFACGCYHTVAVSENGVIYVFGRNNHGQLGTGDTNERVYPFPIDDFVGKRVAMVAAGFYHTVVLTGGKEEERNDQEFGDCDKGDGLVRSDFGGITHSIIMAANPVQDLLDPSESSELDGTATIIADRLKPTSATDERSRGEEMPASNPDDDDYRDEDDRFMGNAGAEGICRRTSSHGGTEKSSADSTDALVVAAAILAQLDRLSQPFLPKPGTAPPLQHPTTKSIGSLLANHNSSSAAISSSADLGDVFEGGFEPFVIHVCSSTFDSLAALLKHLSTKKIEATSQLQLCLQHQQQQQKQGASSRGPGVTPRRTSSSTQANQVQTYMLLVCLRILQANLTQLLRSGLAKSVILFSLGNGASPEGPPEKTPYIQELDRLRLSILQVRNVLVALIDIKFSKNVCYVIDNTPTGGENASRIATEACNTLMQGFELFFPCQCVQRQVIMHVVHGDFSVDSTPHESCGIVCHHHLWSINVMPKAKALLLGPLLRRMAEDSFILRFLHLAESSLQITNSTPPGVGKTPLTTNGKQLSAISDIWETVLERVAVEFAQQLGDLAAVSSSTHVPKYSPVVTSSFFVLLSGLQKHISSWAASCIEWRIEHEDKCDSLDIRTANVIDRVFRLDAEDLEKVPISWRCLLDFALAVTTQCCDIFAQVLLSDAAPSPTCAGAYQSELGENVTHAEPRGLGVRSVVEQSIIGQTLPSLIGSLFKFSNKPLFAVGLLPNLKGLLRLLDDFNQRDPAVAEAETQFIEGIAYLALNRQASKTEEGKSRHRSASSTLAGSARSEEAKTPGSRGSAISDAMALPWNYRLQKEMAILVSEMAVTLVIGDPCFTCDFSRSADSKSTHADHTTNTHISPRWFSSPLFRGGLRPRLITQSIVKKEPGHSRTSRHTPFPTAGIAVPASLRGDFAPFSLALPPVPSPLEDGGTGHRVLPSDLTEGHKYVQAFCTESVQGFLSCFHQCADSGEGVSEVCTAAQNICNWVRDSYSKRDPSYRMITRQAQAAMRSQASANTSEHQIHVNDVRIEVAMFAALLHHNVLGQQAFHFALAQGHTASTTRNSPPRSFLTLWSFVAELRRRVASKKTQIKNENSTIGNALGDEGGQRTLERICSLQDRILNRCKLLLLIEVYTEEEHLASQLDAGFIPPFDPALIGSSTSAFKISDQSVKRHLHATYTHNQLPFLAAFPLSKWRIVRVLVHTVIRWKYAATVYSRKSNLAGGLSQEVVDYVASDEDVSSSNAIKLLLVDPCRRISCSSRGLEIILELLTMVAFDSIQADVVHQVSHALNFQTSHSQLMSFPQSGGYQHVGYYYSGLRNEALTEFLSQLTDMMTDKASLMFDTSGICTMPSCWIVIELLSLWGLHFDTEQFEVVSDIGILAVIREMLQLCSPTSGVTSRAASGRSNVSSPLTSANDASARGGDQAAQLQATISKQKGLLNEALWVLFRYIGIHLAAQSTQLDSTRYPTSRHEICAPAYPTLSSVVDLIYKEAVELSRELLPSSVQEAPLCNEEPAGTTPLAPGAMRRSFEMIKLPRRFSSLNRSLTFTYDEMISPPCTTSPVETSVPMSPLLQPNEYSITAWIFVNPSTQLRTTSAFPGNPNNPDERQLVFLRGADHEISLYMLLQPESPGNWQLEVGFLMGQSKYGEANETKAGSSSGFPLKTHVWERVLSKQVVGGGRWVHVAVVLEASKIRLYLNGILDCQRLIATPSIPTWASGSVKLPFHFGRFPAVAVTDCSTPSISVGPSVTSALELLSGSLTRRNATASRNFGITLAKNASTETEVRPTLGAFQCFDGWLCNFRFHNRSLSPIHVRIIFDEKNQTKIPLSDSIASEHTKIIELHALLIALTTSSEGTVHFVAQFPKWMRLLWGSFLGSSNPIVQQSTLRVLHSLLPLQHPTVASQVLLQDDQATAQCDEKEFGFYSLEDAFMQQLFRMIGFCLSKCPSEKIPACRDTTADTNEPESIPLLPWTLMLAQGIHGNAFSPFIRATSQQIAYADNVELVYQASKGQCLALANELVQLTRRLLGYSDGNNLWKQSIARVASQIVSSLPGSGAADSQKLSPFVGLRFGDCIIQASVVRKVEAVGCLYALGGGLDMLRPGATVKMRGTSEFARVIALEPRGINVSAQTSTSRVGSSQSKPDSTDTIAFVAISGSGMLGHLSSLQPSFHGCALPIPASTSSWYQKVLGHNSDRKGVYAGYRHVSIEDLNPTEAASLANVVAAGWDSLFQSKNQHYSKPVSRALVQKAEEVLFDCHKSNLALQWDSGGVSSKAIQSMVGSAEDEMLSAHSLCLLLKALTPVAGSDTGTFELLTRPGLVSHVLRLAISEDGNPGYDTLSRVERKVALVRQQLYTVVVGLGDEAQLDLASYHHSKIKGVGASSNNTKDQGAPREITDTQNNIHREQSDFDPWAKIANTNLQQEEHKFGEESTDGAHASMHTPGSEVHEDNDEDEEGEEEGEEDEDESMDEDEEDEDEMDEVGAEFVEELMLMGFPEDWCVLALKQTDNDIVSASAWIVDNLEYLSKLQSTLDKHRDQGRDSPRFDEEVDDITNFDETSSTESGRSPEHGVSNRSNADANSANMRIDSGGRANNISDRCNLASTGVGREAYIAPPLNDKEMGRKIFGEMYFPFEEGGYLSNTLSQFLHSWQADTVERKISDFHSEAPSAYNGTNGGTSGSLNGANGSPFGDEFQAQVNQLPFGDLVRQLRSLERTLAILYARRCICTLLQQVSLSDGEFGDAERLDTTAPTARQRLVIAYDDFFRLLKLVLRRGDQFTVFSKSCRESAGNNPVQASSIESVFASAFDYFAALDMDRFTRAAFDFCLQEFEAAASSKPCEAFLWGQRELQRPDKAVASEPGVEVAAWTLDILLAKQRAPQSVHSLESATEVVWRLRCCLSATNLPLKFLVISTISRILMVLCNSESVVHHKELVRETQLSVADFLRAAKLRHKRESVQDRLLFSLYLQGYVEILLVLRRVTGFEEQSLESHLSKAALTVPYTANDGENPSQTVENLLPPATPRSQTAEDCSLCFDRKRSRSSLLAFADDGLSVSYSGNEVWKAACATVCFSTGVHSWEVRIEKSSSPYLFVGIATKRASLDSFLGSDEQSWGFIGDKAIYYLRNRLRSYGETFTEGDCIGVHLDCEKGELAFTKNGVYLGVAFDNIVGEVCPAVAFYSRHQKVSFVKYSCPSTGDVSSNPITPTGEDESACVEDSLVACEVMQALAERKRLRTSVCSAVHRMTTAWLDGSTKFVTTRAGKSLWVDVSSESCRRLGFQANERVRTPRGNGVIVGVARGRIWVEVDSEPGAWFFHPSKLRLLTLINSPAVALPTPPDNEPPTDISVALQPPTVSANRSDETQRIIDGAAVDSVADATQSAFSLSPARLAEISAHPNWNLAVDRELLEVVNDFCEVSRISPWNLTAEQLLNLVREKAAVLEITVMASALALPQDVREQLVVARFALLRFCNVYVSRALPFFDLTYHYFLLKSSPLPGRLLSQCRGSLFVCVKNALFTALMEKTANSPKRADDEYDYPDDLPQLQVNRLKAAAAKCHPGTTDSLFLSLFGQSFEELHFLPLKTLRMVYSHPMDDGQLRSFKVKFEGEGVDDYGGPYREFFSQFFAELQMLQVPPVEDRESETLAESNGSATGKQESGASVSACLLPFFLPSPNWRNGVGANREKFVLNGALISREIGSKGDSVWRASAATDTLTAAIEQAAAGYPQESAEEKRQLYCEMFYFLGQMLGICLRTRVCVRLDLAMAVWKQLVAEDDSDPESALATLKEIDFVAYSLWKTLKNVLEDHKRLRTESDEAVVTTKTRKLEDQLETMDLDFTTVLSDGRSVELCSNGSSTAVTLDNLETYLDAMLLARMNETQEVMNIVKQGLNSILPVSAMALLTWSELEKRMCGVAEVDVKLLQSNTEYDEELSAEDEYIQRFWRVLEGLDAEDKRAFLRFVWARSRLPLGSAQFHQKFKIQALVASGSDGGSGAVPPSGGWMDSQLPKSHTCFFALQLPRYSTDEICRMRLLYAIRNCVEMDGDFRLADTEMTGWTGISATDQLRM